MFEFIKKRKAIKEFQKKYNLSNNEMTCIVFSKIGDQYQGSVKRTSGNLYVYMKISQLIPILTEKLMHANTKFEVLSSKFSKENIFNSYKNSCNKDMKEFLFLFQLNSSYVRITFSEDATEDQMIRIWDKADAYLEAIYLYYLLELNHELKEYRKIAIFSVIYSLIKINKVDLKISYQEIRSYIVEMVHRFLSSTVEQIWENEWYGASILTI